MVKKLLHPFRVSALVLVLICVLIVFITVLVLGYDAIIFIWVCSLLMFCAWLFFDFTLLPCFDSLTGSCCGGFFSNKP